MKFSMYFVQFIKYLIKIIIWQKKYFIDIKLAFFLCVKFFNVMF